MLALKKKREAEAKVAAEEKAQADKMEVETPASTTAAAAGPAKVSLLGIGGKKKSTGKNGDSKTAGKKRSPGEIRIQKGTFSYSNDPNIRHWTPHQKNYSCPSALVTSLALHLILTIFFIVPFTSLYHLIIMM
jgi:hypothetical protein